jgi:hypothetical protein
MKHPIDSYHSIYLINFFKLRKFNLGHQNLIYECFYSLKLIKELFYYIIIRDYLVLL